MFRSPGRAVDHRRAQDRPGRGRSPRTIVLGRQAHRLRRGVQRGEDGGRRDEHGPRDARLLGRGHDRRGVPEAERRQVDEGVGAAGGEGVVERRRVVEVAMHGVGAEGRRPASAAAALRASADTSVAARRPAGAGRGRPRNPLPPVTRTLHRATHVLPRMLRYRSASCRRSKWSATYCRARDAHRRPPARVAGEARGWRRPEPARPRARRRRRPPSERISAGSPRTDADDRLAGGEVLEDLRRDERAEQRDVAQRDEADVGGGEQLGDLVRGARRPAW